MFQLTLPRVPLAHLPTPIEALTKLRKHLGGPRLYVKRDDCTGLGMGGNKTRKLEFLLADALNKGADVLITEGGAQSNHCRQTAAAAAKANLQCVLVLNSSYAKGENGNLLLDHLLGARCIHVGTAEDRQPTMRATAKELQAAGKNPYIIPTGGSNGIGAFGYVNALMEITQQQDALGLEFDHIVVASGSGGTQGGLVLGRQLLNSPATITGISDGEPAPVLRDAVLHVARTGSQIIEQSIDFADDDVTIFDEYYGDAYGTPNPEMIAAVKLLARTEGLLLDPVYSGKAMAGLIDLIEQRHFSRDSTILFIHTGGSPALFAYQSSFDR